MIEEKYIADYWNGNTNKAIRYYFYIQRGLSLVNEARYLIMAILAIYAILKLDNWLIMPLMFFSSLPILGILGYISVHHMSKKMDYYSNFFGSHYTKKSLEIQEETLEALNKLNERLGNGNIK
jgi:hypothetical protein